MTVVQLLSVTLPPLFAVALSLLIEKLSVHVKNRAIRSLLFCLFGLSISLPGLWLINLLCVLNQVAPVNAGSFSSALLGASLGLVLSMTSAAFFFLVYRPRIAGYRVLLNLPFALIANVFPAFVEEVGFRGGLVHFLDQFLNANAAVLVGSLSFGLAHLASYLPYRLPSFKYLLAATSAGLLLSYVYITYGLSFAIGLHLLWNSLCGCWVSFFCLKERNGRDRFEGDWAAILPTLCLALFLMAAQHVQFR